MYDINKKDLALLFYRMDNYRYRAYYRCCKYKIEEGLDGYKIGKYIDNKFDLLEKSAKNLLEIIEKERRERYKKRRFNVLYL